MFFCFLWDDPLFNNDAVLDHVYLRDEEFLELRRRARLNALEVVYMRIAELERALAREKQHHTEAQAREVWTMNKFLEHVPEEAVEGILIDRKVNDMDPDFSFINAITEKG